MPLTQEQMYMWEHAVLIYRNFAWREALIIFKHLADIIQDEGEVTRCRINEGLIHARLGDYSSARDSFSNLPRAGRHSAIACCVLAEIAVCAGDSAEALAWYDMCHDALTVRDVQDELTRFEFVLEQSTIRGNILLLETTQPKKPVDIRFLGLYRLPAHCIFLPKPPANATDSAVIMSSIKSLSLSGESMYEDPAEPSKNMVMQWLHNAAAAKPDRLSRSLPVSGVLGSTDAEKVQEVATASPPRRGPRMIARDAQIDYVPSTRTLQEFLRNTGPVSPGESSSVAEHGYIQYLSDNDSRPNSVLPGAAPRSVPSRSAASRSSTSGHRRLESINEDDMQDHASRSMKQNTHRTTPTRAEELHGNTTDADRSSVDGPLASLDILWPNKHQWLKKRKK